MGNVTLGRKFLARIALFAGLLVSACDAPDAGPEQSQLKRSSYAVPALALRISTLSYGNVDGQRVIFVHGTPGDAHGWRQYLAAPPSGVDAIAIDRPGFGQTRPETAFPSLARQAEAIAPLLVKRNGRWPILVGHSLGGPIIAQVAADYPGKVESLVILAGSFDPAQEQIYGIQYVAEWRGVRSMLPRTVRNANLELLGLKPQLEALAPRLSAIRCRVTIVQGTADTNVPFANLPFLQAHLTGAEKLRPIVLKGRNHFIPWTERSVIAAALGELLRTGSRSC